MATVAFRLNNGEEKAFEAKSGWTVMQTAMRNGVPGIDADCGGSASCATCHVYVDEAWLDRIGSPETFEVEMLDLIPSRRSNSRLSCQIVVSPELDGLAVEVPADQINISL